MNDIVERLRKDAQLYRTNMGAGDDALLNYQWSDKPHRHVYDLCRRLEEAADELERLRAALASAEVRVWNEAIEAAADRAKVAWITTEYGSIADADAMCGMCEDLSAELRTLKKEQP